MKFFQRLGRSLMLPVAVLPVAAILSGISYWISSAAGGSNVVSAFLGAAGGALLDNMPLLFAVGALIGLGHINGPYAVVCAAAGAFWKLAIDASAKNADRQWTITCRSPSAPCALSRETKPGCLATCSRSTALSIGANSAAATPALSLSVTTSTTWPARAVWTATVAGRAP